MRRLQKNRKCEAKDEFSAKIVFGFVTLIERIFGLWSYLAAWLLWCGHIHIRSLGHLPCPSKDYTYRPRSWSSDSLRSPASPHLQMDVILVNLSVLESITQELL